MSGMLYMYVSYAMYVCYVMYTMNPGEYMLVFDVHMYDTLGSDRFCMYVRYVCMYVFYVCVYVCYIG